MVRTDLRAESGGNAERYSRLLLIAVSVIWIPLAGYAHFVTGPQYEFHLVFLLPVVSVCWFAGLKAGALTTLLSAGVWMIADWQHTPDLSVLLINEAVRLSVFVLVVVLVDRLRSALDRESALARLDPLTRLSNRRDFEERGDVEIARARRYGHPLTLISLDLDNFKAVNDRDGHAAGDRLLRAVAESLSANIRATDVVARTGGDEFVILLPETDSEAAGEIAAKLQERLRQAMRAGGWPVTASFGVLTSARAPESIDALVRGADRLLYDAKGKGKDAICRQVARS